MDKQNVFAPDFKRELAQRLQERKPFDVAHSAAYFRDENVNVFACRIHSVFDFVRDVGDNLNGFAQIVAPAFLLQDVLVNLPRSQIVETAELAMGETLVVPEVEVGFRAVVKDVNFAVLERAHCPGVYVQIRVEFLYSDLQISGFQKRAQRAGSQTLPQRGNHTACNKNILHFGA